MEFLLTPEQRRLRQEISAFARAELNAGIAERDREQRFPRELWEKCGRLRLGGLFVPEEYGGRGLDPLSATIALEGLGYGCLDGGLTFSICAHLLACVVPIWRHGTEGQKRHYLPRLSDGTWIAANAMTEPHSGSDAFGLRTRAVPSGDGFLLTGRKLFVSNGPVADVIVMYALTDPEKRYYGGITCFAIERSTPGVTVGQQFEKLGLRTCALGELVFDDAWVSADTVIGGVGGGANIFSESMDWERACLAAAHIGTMERLVEQAVARTKSADDPNAASQGLAHTIVEMKVRLEASRLLTYRAAWQLGQSRDTAMNASIAKLFVSESLVAATRDVVQMLGAAAVVDGSDAERIIRDSAASTVYSGTSHMQREIIARWLGIGPRKSIPRGGALRQEEV